MAHSYDIAFVGSGNLATHLAKNLQKAGHRIVGVSSRRLERAEQLAAHLSNDMVAVDNPLNLPEAEIYILAIADDALESLWETWRPPTPQTIVLHTSGSVSINSLRNLSTRYGVLYPLQTFSVDRPLDFSEIPCFVEGSSEEITQRLLELAKSVSNLVHVLDSERRKTLHLAAVFACNFVNHLYDVASSLMETKNLSPQWLLPLISETAKKVADLSPHDAQTGPARRGDRRVMEAHLMQLESHSEWKKLYEVLSDSIFHQFHHD